MNKEQVEQFRLLYELSVLVKRLKAMDVRLVRIVNKVSDAYTEDAP